MQYFVQQSFEFRMSDFSLHSKVALVTGANGLLGKNHCKALKDAGATVVATDLGYNQDLISEYADEVYCMDVTDKSSIQNVFEKINQRYDRLDILINNAAINDMFESPALASNLSKFENYPLEMWQRSIEVNMTGVFLCSQVFGTAMARRGYGSIINIASTYGVVAPDQQLYKDNNGLQSFYKSIAYPATKSAVLGMTRFLAAYWGRDGVRVNALSPGGVLNQQESWFIHNYEQRTCLGRMANPNDYCGALVFLASDASIYMTGANLIVDGGWTAI